MTALAAPSVMYMMQCIAVWAELLKCVVLSVDSCGLWVQWQLGDSYCVPGLCLAQLLQGVNFRTLPAG